MAKANSTNDFYYDPYYDPNSGSNYTMGDTLKGTGGGSTYITDTLKLRQNTGIFGIPYQFLPSVDRRLDDDNHMSGRKYTEKILSRAPLLFLVPCRQEFMENFSKDDKGNVLNQLLTGGSIENQLDKTGRYYTTVYQYDEYYDIVNRMCTVMSKYMGLDQVPVIKGDGSQEKLYKVAWQEMNSENFRQYFAVKEAVIFYVDGLTSISDSFSNSTTESSLASSINNYSDQAKEVRFLLGNDSLLTGMADTIKDTISGVMSSNLMETVTAGLTNGMIADLSTTGVSTVLSGGKIIFPKIWGDSSFNRSYSFDIKLRSPDHDSLSILMNVIVPYLHLLGLVMPKSIAGENFAAGSPNSYTSPFLVRAYAKGMFNINMGIITDLTATRGAACEWNVDGLPTQIDISITIEDLYSNLFVTDPGGPNMFANNWDLVTNTEFMDFLANLGGLNVATDVNNRKLAYLKALTEASIARAPATIYTYFENFVSNKFRRLWDILN